MGGGTGNGRELPPIGNHYELLFEIVDGGARLNLYERRRDGVLEFLSSGVIPGGQGWLASGGAIGSPKCTVHSRTVEHGVNDALKNLGYRLGQEFTYTAHAIRTDIGAIGFSYRSKQPKN